MIQLQMPSGRILRPFAVISLSSIIAYLFWDIFWTIEHHNSTPPPSEPRLFTVPQLEEPLETQPLVTSSLGPQPVRLPKCSPETFSNGRWVRKADIKEVHSENDVYEAAGFLGCASHVNVGWHLGNSKPDEFGWRTNASAYQWVSIEPECLDVGENFSEDLIAGLVQRGGWLLIGDSVTEEHFFSLSCLLWPHVRPESDLSEGRHDWPQDLHLNPDSPFVQRLTLPEGFNITSTPIVSFQRNDLLFSKHELYKIYRSDPLYRRSSAVLFGDQLAYNLATVQYISRFLRHIPEANYRALILSTGGHWSTEVFEGLKGKYPQVLEFFMVATRHLIDRLAEALDSDGGQGKHVIYRPYLPGDWGCREPGIVDEPPLHEPPVDLRDQPWNWGWIPLYNRVWREAIAAMNHPRIHYIGIDRPGRMRPDTHVIFDCLHLTVGTGVIEVWSQYIHYYLSNLD